MYPDRALVCQSSVRFLLTKHLVKTPCRELKVNLHRHSALHCWTSLALSSAYRLGIYSCIHTLTLESEALEDKVNVEVSVTVPLTR